MYKILLLFISCYHLCSAASLASYRDPSILRRRIARNNNEPYWNNPCGELPITSLTGRPESLPATDRKSNGTPSGGSLKHHFVAIRNYAESLTKLIQGLKVKKEGTDPFLRNQISLFELANFPKPPQSLSFVSDISSLPIDSILSTTFKLLQFAAVHLQSTENDETIYDGHFVDDIDDLQRGPNGLQFLMCSVKMAMNQAGAPVDRAVDQDLKNIDTTPIGDSSRRNLRDILRLNGTMKILMFVHNLFSKLRETAIQAV